MPSDHWVRPALKKEAIVLPPLAEQRAIAAVLDSIDEAIERTEEVITATERLRDALLHELLTRGLPGWHSESAGRARHRDRAGLLGRRAARGHPGVASITSLDRLRGNDPYG